MNCRLVPEKPLASECVQMQSYCHIHYTQFTRLCWTLLVVYLFEECGNKYPVTIALYSFCVCSYLCIKTLWLFMCRSSLIQEALGISLAFVWKSPLGKILFRWKTSVLPIVPAVTPRFNRSIICKSQESQLFAWRGYFWTRGKHKESLQR